MSILFTYKFEVNIFNFSIMICSTDFYDTSTNTTVFFLPQTGLKIYIYFCLSVSSAIFPAATGAWIINMVELFDRFPVLIALLLCFVITVTSWLVCHEFVPVLKIIISSFHVPSTAHGILMYFINILCLFSVYVMRVHQMLSTDNYFPLNDKQL